MFLDLRADSLQAAKATGKSESKVSPWASLSRSLDAICLSSSSLRASISGSTSLIFARRVPGVIFGTLSGLLERTKPRDLIYRSLLSPKMISSNLPNISGKELTNSINLSRKLVCTGIAPLLRKNKAYNNVDAVQ